MTDPIRRSIDRLKGVQMQLANVDGEGFILDFSWTTIQAVIRDLSQLLE